MMKLTVALSGATRRRAPLTGLCVAIVATVAVALVAPSARAATSPYYLQIQGGGGAVISGGSNLTDKDTLDTNVEDACPANSPSGTRDLVFFGLIKGIGAWDAAAVTTYGHGATFQPALAAYPNNVNQWRIANQPGGSSADATTFFPGVGTGGTAYYPGNISTNARQGTDGTTYRSMTDLVNGGLNGNGTSSGGSGTYTLVTACVNTPTSSPGAPVTDPSGNLVAASLQVRLTPHGWADVAGDSDGPPTAALSAASASATAGQPLALNGSGSAAGPGSSGITDYSWTFTNAAGTIVKTDDTGTTPTDTYAFTGAGTYTAALTVTQDDQQTAMATETITVTAASPTAALAAASTTGTVGQPVSLDGSGSSAGAGSSGITDYSWKFTNAAGTVVETDDTNTTPTDTYTFDAPGTYTATLTVMQDDQQTAMASETITVAVAPPKAVVAVASATGTVGQAVTLNGSGSTAGMGSTGITDYAWTYADAAGNVVKSDDTGTTPTDTYTFSAPGTYTATLTVTEQGGRTATATESITVQAAPTTTTTTTTTPTTTPITTTTPPAAGSTTPPVTGRLSASSKSTTTGATVRVMVSKAGQVKVVATAKVEKKVKGKNKPKTITVWSGSKSVQAGASTLALKPSSAAKALLKRGALTVSIKVTYTPAGGQAVTKTVSARLPKTKKTKKTVRMADLARPAVISHLLAEERRLRTT